MSLSLANTLTTIDHKLNLAYALYDQVVANNMYVFLAYSDLQANGLADIAVDRKLLTSRNMVVLKKLTASDVAMMIGRRDYTIGEVYSIADQNDTQETTIGKDYAILEDGSYYYVIQCLFNSLGAPSTVAPEISSMPNIGDVVQTADGYRWRLVYKIDKTLANKFRTSTLFPIQFSNNTVDADTYITKLDSFHILESGSRYENYLPSAQFLHGSTRVQGNNFLFQVSANCATVNNFYNGCIIQLTSGSGSGEYRKIDDYISNANGNFVVLDQPWLTPEATDLYRIYPRVEITPEGEETTAAVAIAIVDPLLANGVSEIEVITSGVGYNWPLTANVIHDSTVPVDIPAEITPILAIEDQFHLATKIKPSAFALTCTITGSETNTIISSHIFNQVGLIKDPRFNAVSIETTTANGVMIAGEPIFEINPITITTAGSFTANSVTLNFPSALDTKFDAGDSLIISYATFNHLRTVASQPNTTALTLTEVIDPVLASNTAVVRLALPINTMTVNTVVDTNTIVLQEYIAPITVGNHLFSQSSEQLVKIEAVQGVSTSNGCEQWHLMINSGPGFTIGETVTQNQATAIVVAASNVVSGEQTIAIADQVGDLTENQLYAVVGGTSATNGSPVAKYPMPIQPFTGQILYLENIASNARTANQATAKIDLVLDL